MIARSILRLVQFCAAIALTCAAGYTQAITIRILDNPFASSGDIAVNSFYNAHAGFTSSLFTGTVTAAQLSGADLLFVAIPDHALDSGEISAMSAFLAGGGRIVFNGETTTFVGNPAANNRINAALAALGSTMSLITSPLDGGAPPFATVANGRILPHPLTAGIAAFYEAGSSAVTGVAPGNGLFSSDSSPGTLVGGFDPLLGDGIVLMGDQNWMQFVPDFFEVNVGIFNNRFALNLALVDVSAAVPAPGSAWLILFGVVLLTLPALRQNRRVNLPAQT